MSIKSSISDFLKVDELKLNLLTLLEAKFELKKLEVQGKLEGILADVVVKLLIGVFVFLAFIMLNVLIAIGINQLSETIWLGYLILLVIYSSIATFFYFKKDIIKETVIAKIEEGIESAGI